MALIGAALLFAGAGPIENRHLESLIQPGVQRGYPGIAVIIRDHNGRIDAAAAGYSDVQRQLKMKPTDAFHIGSITKTFTAVVILQLADEGKLALADTLSKLLGPAVARLPNADKITIAQLLDHSSGIYATNNDAEYLATLLGSNADPRRIWSFADLLRLADKDRRKPLGEPGHGHWYSDTNYILLGMIAEKASGRPLREEVRRRVFTPLHMTHSYFLSEAIRGAPVPKTHEVHGYLVNTRDMRQAITINAMFRKVGTRKEGDLYDTTLAAERNDAAGGIITTLPDLVRYADALFHGRLVSKSSQTFWTSSAADMTDQPIGKHRTWALQSVHEPYGVVLYKEGDGPGGSTCLMSYIVAADQIFAGCTNSIGYFDEVDFMLEKIIPGALNRSE